MSAPVVVSSTLPGAQPAVVVRDGFKVCALPTDQSLAERPRRIEACVKVYESDSFAKYFADYRDADSRIFADDSSGVILAILDYHEDNIEARWCKHRVQLTLRKSEEWILWTGQNTKRMSQEEFARFLEDNSPDLVSPEPAAMIEMARSMTAKADISVESAVRTNRGATFRYNETTKAGGIGPAGEFTVPDEFIIQIPVYVGEPPISIKARLRYQITSSKLNMWYDLWRHATAERAAFRQVRDRIQQQTEVTILSGSPS